MPTQTPPPSITPVCEYRMTSTVHELVFHTATRRAVDVFFAYMNSALERQDPQSPMPLLITLPPLETPPVLYFMAQMQAWEQGYHALPKMATALLYSENLLPALVTTTGNMLFRRRSGDVVRSFPVTQRERALSWLYRQTLLPQR